MSAQRFGGTFSPGGDPSGTPPPPNRFRGRKARAVDVRALLMFVLPTPLLLAAIGAIGDSALAMAGYLLAYAVLILGAWLLREGQRAEAAYNDRQIARPPAFPRKLCAAGLVGVGVFLASWFATPPAAGGTLAQITSFGGNIVNALIFGVLAAGAHVVAFGTDPMRAKGVTDTIRQAELDRVTEALDKAEAKLREIESLAHRLRDREIDTRVGALNATVRSMIRLVEEDPRDLSRARRYLGVYLKGAADATRKYADNHERLADPKLRDDYLALLADLEEGFSRGKQTLLVDDRADLEVEIEVLRERLQQEGS